MQITILPLHMYVEAADELMREEQLRFDCFRCAVVSCQGRRQRCQLRHAPLLEDVVVEASFRWASRIVQEPTDNFS